MRGCFVGLVKFFRMVDEGTMTYDHLRFHDSVAPLNLSPSILSLVVVRLVWRGET